LAISESGGAILDFQLFSDLNLSLTVDIEESKIFHLHARLNKIASISGGTLKGLKQLDYFHQHLFYLWKRPFKKKRPGNTRVVTVTFAK